MSHKIEHRTDESLMQGIQNGEEDAFNELYQRYSQRIVYFMYKMLRQDEAKAQDLMQDVFLKIVEAPQKFDLQKSFKTWIFTVAANRCKNYFRAQKEVRMPLNAAFIVDTKVANFEDQEQQLLFEQNVARAIHELAIPFKETFLLKYKEGFSLKEIAQIMDCPLGTVKSRLSAATKKLAHKLSYYQSIV
jgi:RNA polymerase sigma-70 factor (ECF subfamily)